MSRNRNSRIGWTIIGCALSMAWCASVQADAVEQWDLDTLIHDLTIETSSITCFRETKTDGMLEVPIKLTGELQFIPPDVLVKSVNTPFHERYEIHDDYFLRSTSEHGSDRFSMDEFPVVRAFVASFRAALTGNRTLLERYYQVVLKGNREHWQILLHPKDIGLKKFISSVELHGAYKQIHTIDTYETNGDYSHLRIGKSFCPTRKKMHEVDPT